MTDTKPTVDQVLDAAGIYLLKQYGATYGLHHEVDRARIKAILEDVLTGKAKVEVRYGLGEGTGAT